MEMMDSSLGRAECNVTALVKADLNLDYLLRKDQHSLEFLVDQLRTTDARERRMVRRWKSRKEIRADMENGQVSDQARFEQLQAEFEMLSKVVIGHYQPDKFYRPLDVWASEEEGWRSVATNASLNLATGSTRVRTGRA